MYDCFAVHGWQIYYNGGDETMEKLLQRLEQIKEQMQHTLFITCDNMNIRISSSDFSSIQYILKLFYIENTNGIRILEVGGTIDYYIYSIIFEPVKYNHFIDLIINELTYQGVVHLYKNSEHYYYSGKVHNCQIVAYVFCDEGIYAVPNCIIGINNVIFTCSRQGDSDHKLAARLLREVTYRHLINKKYICVHSSAIKINDKGVLFIGNSGSGKTTLSLLMCKRYGAEFLANDRVFITRKNNILYAIPFAYAIKLNKGTLYSLDEVENYTKWKICEDIPKNGSDWDQFNGVSKMHILPSELQSELGIKLTSKIKIDMVVYLAHNNDMLDKNDNINNNCFVYKDEDFPFDWFNIVKKDNNEVIRKGISILSDLKKLPSVQFIYSISEIDTICSSIEKTTRLLC